MTTLFTITQGWTAQLGPFTLRLNGSPLDLSSMTVNLKLRSSANSAFVDTVGDVSVDADQAGAGRGRVYYKPDPEDFNALHSPYFCRFEVIDTAGNVVYFPEGAPYQILVHPA